MNERNLSRRLSSSVVEALKAHGHILVVKGGATALARELDDLMAPFVATIEPRLRPYTPLVGEPTSTFGDETVDQAVEDMVLNLTHALMNSDHVEDVFAEDAVIRRDIFRVVRDGLREPNAVFADGGDASDDGDHASITVKLDTLGYVAATASRRTDAATLRQALDRAASVAGAQFSGWSPELREATFRLEGSGVDERLEIEEAVADELTDLVEQGFVELPTVERRIDLGRAFPASELRALRARVDAAGEATLLRSGCAAAWEIEGSRTLRILFTPLSEQDAAGLDAPTSAFARELATLLGSGAGGREAVRIAGAEAPAATAARSDNSGSSSSSGAASARKPARATVEASPSSKRSAAPATSADDEDSVPTLPVKRKVKAAVEPAPAAAPAGAAKPAKAEPAKAAAAKRAAKPAAARKRAGESESAAAEAPRAKAPASSRKSTAGGSRSKASAPRATGKQAPTAAKATKAPSKKR